MEKIELTKERLDKLTGLLQNSTKIILQIVTKDLYKIV